MTLSYLGQLHAALEQQTNFLQDASYERREQKQGTVLLLQNQKCSTRKGAHILFFYHPISLFICLGNPSLYKWKGMQKENENRDI